MSPTSSVSCEKKNHGNEVLNSTVKNAECAREMGEVPEFFDKNNFVPIMDHDCNRKDEEMDPPNFIGFAPKSAIESTDEVQSRPESSTFVPPRIYKCYYCTKYFFHVMGLRRHTMSRHKDQIFEKSNAYYRARQNQKINQLVTSLSDMRTE